MRRMRLPVRVSEEARALQERSLVVDLHTDSLLASRILGLDLAEKHRAPRGLSPWMLHADIPRLREGGVDAVFLGIVTHPWPRKAFERALAYISHAHRLVEENPEDLLFAAGPEQVEQARSTNRMAVLIGVEGMHILGGRIERIEVLYRLGARYITLAHFTTNVFAASSADIFRRGAVLSEKGIMAVEIMNELGMMIDLSHTHTDVIREVCWLTRKPVIVSHGATRAVRPVFRNLTDEDIYNVAGTGGVIGLIYASNWLSTGFSTPHLSVVVDHADHIKKLVGADHIALGSDWDGGIKTPDGMADASDLPALTQLFLDRGYSQEEIEKILGLNFMRVFRETS